MNIYEKILAVMADVQYLSKDDSVSFGKTSYKALSEEKVTNIMRKELLKHKMVVFPIQQSSYRDGTISHVDVTYRMVNAENPEEYIDIVSCGDGADTQDKGAGKAMTYAYKYMWLRTFALPTGEDPDKIASEELDAQKETICEVCGKPISNSKRTDGSVWTSKEIAQYTLAKFGKRMCADCGAKTAKESKDA